jgi:hypothetical protein
MASFSDYTENLVLTGCLPATAQPVPPLGTLACLQAAPSDTGGGTEVSGSGYARTATGTITVSGTATTATNAAAIEFAAASGGNWGAIGWAAIFDASAAATCLHGRH